MNERENPANAAGRPYMQNRELSWLRFNERVLLEATDEMVPLLERLKFISIFLSNLDEFFMIRVGSLHDLSLLPKPEIDNKTGLTASQQLDRIFAAVRPLIDEKDNIYGNLRYLLGLHGVHALNVDELDKADLKYLKQLFQSEIDPILSPQIIDSHHPFPHLANKVMHIGALMKSKSKGKEVFGVIPVPPTLPEIVYLPGEQLRYVHTSDVVLSFADKVFKGYEIAEKTVFCVTRNADITPNEEAFDAEVDFRSTMKSLLRQRTRLAAVRLELSCEVSGRFRQYFCQKLQLRPEQLYVTRSPMSLSYAFSLADRLTPAQREELTYAPFTPQPPACVAEGESMLRQASKGDMLFSYPFESMDSFLALIKEAGSDSSVVSIKITIYRLASRAKLVDYLCAAAENGKEVTVMIELRARFDEQNNIDWSQRLEDAGCRVLYGFDAYKVHSKVCLITRRDRNGALSYITQIGTGNYNEKTALQYTDLSYITPDRQIGEDANEFFKNLSLGELDGEYKRLLVAPNRMKTKIIELIDREMAKGDRGRILLKLNSVTDIELIEKLRDASCAGVRITMIVRGICCILPRVEGQTDNITVRSIVGRFLEHSRVYVFGEGEDEIMYISSADFMTRNMNRRVEAACPVLSADARARIHRLLEVQLADNTKARLMNSDGTYRRTAVGQAPVSSQDTLIQDAVDAALAPRKAPKKSLWRRIREAFSQIGD